MKLICSPQELSDALTKVSKAVPLRSTIPVLEGIKLEAEGNTLTVSATDNAFSIQKIINASVFTEGSTVVPGRLFSEFLRKVSSDTVDLELTSDNQMLLKYGDGETSIRCFYATEYPEIMTYNYDMSVAIKQNELREMINRVIFCAPQDANENRRNIKGVLFECADGEIKMVALDGYRLGIAKKEYGGANDSFKIVIPSKNMAEIGKLLEDEETALTLCISKNRLLVDCGHLKITTGLLGEDFFEYSKIINSEESTVITLNRKQFEACLERAQIMSREEKSYQVRLEIKEGFMTIESNSGTGEVNEKVAVSLSGKDLTIAFNSKFLSDCTKAINDEFIKISFGNSVSPCIIEPAEGKSFLYLIIPIRIVG